MLKFIDKSVSLHNTVMLDTERGYNSCEQNVLQLPCVWATQPQMDVQMLESLQTYLNVKPGTPYHLVLKSCLKI